MTERLRLEPIGTSHVDDYVRVFNDDAVAAWYGGKPSRAEAEAEVERSARIWEDVGFHKWLAYELSSGEVVGRGGLSAVPLADNKTIRALLPNDSWVQESIRDRTGRMFARRWVEVGWAVRGTFWGRGYASEIGLASLAFAFGLLGMHAVVSFTEWHNARSRAVMERIGMHYLGKITQEGLSEGQEGVQSAAPFALYVLAKLSG
jgi:RimJ/RimL family protein N-acetyltransferase